MSLTISNPTPKNIITHSLNNIEESLSILRQRFQKEPLLIGKFSNDVTLGNYHFDFYVKELKFAIQLDAYSYAYSNIHNTEKIKIVSIPSKNIIVLKISDYQVLVDCDEIIRFIKNYVKNYSSNKCETLYS